MAKKMAKMTLAPTMTVSDFDRLSHACEVLEALAKVQGEEEDEAMWKGLQRKIEARLVKARANMANGGKIGSDAFMLIVAWDKLSGKS